MNDPRAGDRPMPVSFFGWMAFIGGVIGVFAAVPLATLRGPLFEEYWTGPVYEWLLALSAPSFVVVYVLISAFSGWAGWALLQGRNWARVTILVVCVSSVGLSTTLDPTIPLYIPNLLIGVLFTAGYTAAVYRGDGRDFFATAPTGSA